ncbi:protein of unknown function [Agreia sp. COWG]|nr:protein of unknown function [Agreia sp. COWG]
MLRRLKRAPARPGPFTSVGAGWFLAVGWTSSGRVPPAVAADQAAVRFKNRTAAEAREQPGVARSFRVRQFSNAPSGSIGPARVRPPHPP